MKKLMIAVAAIAFAGVVNAASYTWTNGYGLDAYGASDDSEMAAGTIYLMDAATVSQSAFVAAVLGAADYSSAFASQIAKAVNYATLSGSELSSPMIGSEVDGGIKVTEVAATEVTYYQVMLDTANNGVYVSEDITFTPAGTGSEPVDFMNDAAYAGVLFGDTVKTYQGAGWYTAAPEPTSGLLMLLGMAGLALRRRRA